jgi:hypothetical protein
MATAIQTVLTGGVETSGGCELWRGFRFVRFRREQCGALEHPAKIFLARMLMFAVGELEIGGGLVADLKPLEMDNADVIRATFPNLALLKFHGLGMFHVLASYLKTVIAVPYAGYLGRAGLGGPAIKPYGRGLTPPGRY